MWLQSFCESLDREGGKQGLPLGDSLGWLTLLRGQLRRHQVEENTQVLTSSDCSTAAMNPAISVSLEPLGPFRPLP